ncbi:hypothetical protein ACFV7Q_07550 [Streptomyces sp. NPDC059851]|uniref:hypothetical protein n=1 Tax=Streptomyces sp. NPDC059851 TaxID=3346971 RepID=UPI00365DD65B
MTRNDLPPETPAAAPQASPPQAPPPGFGPPVPLPPPLPPAAMAARARRRALIEGAVVVALVGAGAGYLAHALAANARAYCDAAWEAGGRFGMFVQMVGLVPGCAVLAVLVWLLARRVHPMVGVAAVLLVLAVVVVWYFATEGTPAGYRGDSGLCGPDNVPLWWPGWLPS